MKIKTIVSQHSPSYIFFSSAKLCRLLRRFTALLCLFASDPFPSDLLSDYSTSKSTFPKDYYVCKITYYVTK